MKNPIVLFFFFFDFPKNYNKVNLSLTFEAPKGENPNLEEFNEFLDAVSKLHEQIILYTQPEYLNTSPNSRQILDHHKLKIDTLCRKNPFEISLTFHIIQEGIIAYWAFLKALIYFCKKYGKNTDELLVSFNSFKELFSNLYDKFYRKTFLSSLFSGLKIFDNVEHLFEKANTNFIKMMSSRTFKVNYDKFCKTAINITDLISIIQLKDKTEEKQDFFK